MMKNNLLVLSIFTVTLFFQVSCTKSHDDNDCVSFSKAPVIKVDGPTVAAINQAINLEVSFGCSNGCGHFNSFEESATSNSTTVDVIAKYHGCSVCSHDAPVRQTQYSFSSSNAGTYNLKFFQGNNSYLTYSITVQ